MKDENKSLTICLLAGIAGGYASFQVALHPGTGYGNVEGLLIGVAFFALACWVIKLVTGEKTLNWIMRNGGWYFIGAWFITWTILLNVLVK